MFVIVLDYATFSDIVIMKYMYLAMLYPINDLIWVLLSKLLICVHAFVVFNCYLFLYCVCRSKAH